jgi:hypothetical protein
MQAFSVGEARRLCAPCVCKNLQAVPKQASTTGCERPRCGTADPILPGSAAVGCDWIQLEGLVAEPVSREGRHRRHAVFAAESRETLPERTRPNVLVDKRWTIQRAETKKASKCWPSRTLVRKGGFGRGSPAQYRSSGLLSRFV